jgi:hypothetical protein
MIPSFLNMFDLQDGDRPPAFSALGSHHFGVRGA